MENLQDRNVNQKYHICLVVMYIGDFPSWINLYFESCKYNESVDWLFFTDSLTDTDKIPELGNVKFIHTTLKDLKTLFSAKLGLEVSVPKAYKLCEFRPAFGLILNEYLRKYDFWGFTDVDLLYGDIRSFLTDGILDSYDIISSDTTGVSGPFTILKNNDTVNSLFKKSNLYTNAFTNDTYENFDEIGFTQIVLNEAQFGRLRYLFADFEKPRRYYAMPISWKKGSVILATKHEVLFIHFRSFPNKQKPKKVIWLSSSIDEIFCVGGKLYVFPCDRNMANVALKLGWYIYFSLFYIERYLLRLLLEPLAYMAQKLFFLRLSRKIRSFIDF